MVDKALFSSSCEEWGTPLEFFDLVRKTYGVEFSLDAAASDENHICEKYYTKEKSGLDNPWIDLTWCNPPYGRKIDKWIEKAISENKTRGVQSALLLPARTDTAWFHKAVDAGAVPFFVRGRLTFRGAKHPAPFPSVLLLFGHIRIKTFGTLCQHNKQGGLS